MNLLKKTLTLLRLIKIEHTIFAVPFLILSIIVVGLIGPSNTEVNFSKLMYMIICFICARALGMAFNRIIDYQLDFKNPRTQNRPLQKKEIDIKEVFLFIFIITIVFIYSTYKISFYALTLSPFFISYMIFYSYTKRFTYLCHFILGSIHAMLPIAVSIVFFGEVQYHVFFLSFGIMFLIAGSDIIYAIQDINFDIKEKIYSIPAKCGINKSLIISFASYAISLVSFMLFFFYLKNFKPLYTMWAIALSFILLLFVYIKVKKYTTLFAEKAFFLNNIIVSVLLTSGVIFDCYSIGILTLF